MGNPFSSILDLTKTSQLMETGHHFDFTYDDYYKSDTKSLHVHKEKHGSTPKHDDCD